MQIKIWVNDLYHDWLNPSMKKIIATVALNILCLLVVSLVLLLEQIIIVYLFKHFANVNFLFFI